MVTLHAIGVGVIGACGASAGAGTSSLVALGVNMGVSDSSRTGAESTGVSPGKALTPFCKGGTTAGDAVPLTACCPGDAATFPGEKWWGSFAGVAGVDFLAGLGCSPKRTVRGGGGVGGSGGRNGRSPQRASTLVGW
jgi:hypothetical protein